MFKTEVDISMLSPRATVRWKRESIYDNDKEIPKADHRRISSMISTNNPSRFINISLNQTDDSVKVSKHEDLKEISLQLNILRKKHDLNKDSNLHHDNKISRLKKKLENIDQEEKKTNTKINELKDTVERLENETKNITGKQEDALSATNAYKHILERMKISHMKLDIKNEEMNQNTKINNKILIEEIDFTRKNKESKIKTKNGLNLLKSFVEQETKEKYEKLRALDTDVKQKQDNNKKREERFKRQLDIAEAAANEDRDMRDTQMREKLMINRFWYTYQGKKLQKDMEKFASTEEAFQKVRKIAGINDASEMVTKCLTSEVAYFDLIKTVDDSTTRIEEIQEKIKEIESKIANSEKFKTQSNMIEIFRKDVIEKIQIISNDKQKLIKIKGIYEKIKRWTERNLKKFGAAQYKDNLLANLEEIKNKAIKSIKILKEKQPNVRFHIEIKWKFW